MIENRHLPFQKLSSLKNPRFPYKSCACPVFVQINSSCAEFKFQLMTPSEDCCTENCNKMSILLGQIPDIIEELNYAIDIRWTVIQSQI